MSKRATNVLVAFAVLVFLAFVTFGAIASVQYFDARTYTDKVLTENTREVKASSDLLVNCVTPGPNPPPRTGNDCYDRLRTPSQGTSDAVAILIVENDCRNRRARAGLPAPNNTSKCADQTPVEIYPGTP